jgi:hypothetical protein
MFRYNSLPILFYLLFQVISGNAQDVPTEVEVTQAPVFDNAVKFSTGDFRVAGTAHTQQNNPFTQIGLYYERNIYKGLGLGVGYSKWQAFGIFSEHSNITIFEGDYLQPKSGEVYYRSAYRMVDIYAFYKRQIGNRHILNAGIGISGCWGYNTYTTWVGEYPEIVGCMPNFSLSEPKKATYQGAIVSVGYDYMVYRRHSIGFNLRERLYSGRNKAQFDYSLHLGILF